jgi:ABC-type uncharacterized transport system substrate-binding protein
MINLKDNTVKRQVFIVAAAAMVIIIGVYLFLKLDPANVSADNAGFERVPSKQIFTPVSGKQYKILHVMSYHSPWQWTDVQLAGFQTALKGVDVQYHVMQMDTKQRTDMAWIQQISREICNVIDMSRPDLVFTSDDNAQIYVVMRYLNSDIPFVFSAVNEDPAKYGFVGSRNVTGVLERIHYTATVRLLKRLVPSVKKIAIICDVGQMWIPIIEDIKQQENLLPDIEVVSYDVVETYEEFKQKVLEYNEKVDAFGTLGIFEFKDENGKNVSQDDIIKWICQNSKIPDFSFYEDRVNRGELCAVTISGYAQGYQAGLLARKILVDGKSPAELPMKATEEGIPIINIVTAKRLNINPSAEVLLTAKVVQDILE